MAKKPAKKATKKSAKKQVRSPAGRSATAGAPGRKGKSSANGKRPYLRQTDVPIASLDEALRIPQAIFDNYGGRAATPLQIAKALTIDPKGSQIRVLGGAALAFGLTDAGGQAASIGVTELARRALRPTSEGDDLTALREALLKPRVFGDFLQRYDGHALPRPDLAINVLEEMGVPREKADDIFARLVASARAVGFIEEIKGKVYVTLQGVQPTPENTDEDPSDGEPAWPPPPPPKHEPRETSNPFGTNLPKGPEHLAAIADDQRRKRVFITHGKNKDLVDPIRKLLEYGELEPIVSVDRQSVSKPVPEKVMDDMRTSGAAIIHVDADVTITDNEGREHVLLNPNVLIEIGAAMAFYGRRFILLVRDGVKLPSNLQGLYEVRYTNDTLDAAATIKLLEAIKDIKNYALPSQSVE